MPQHQVKTLPLSSSAFQENSEIPSKYTCDGENINPPLAFSSLNPLIKTFALIMEDPDAPNGNYAHWVLWNIPPKTNGIEENSVPAGAVEGKNSSGHIGYTGPCPPSGTHHYYFRLFALDTALPLFEGATKRELERAMRPHILEQTTLIGKYKRK